MSSTNSATSPSPSPSPSPSSPAYGALTKVLQRGISTLVSPASSHASRLAALQRIATVLTAAPRCVWSATQDIPCANVIWALISHLRLLHAQASAATSALLGIRSSTNNQDTKPLPVRIVTGLSEALHEAEQCLLLIPGLILSHSASSDLLGGPGAIDLHLALLGLFAGLRHPYALPDLDLPRIPDSSTIIPRSSLRVLATNLVVLSLRALGPALIGQPDVFGARGGEEMVDQIRPRTPPDVGSVPRDEDRKVSDALDEFLTLVYHPDQAVRHLASSYSNSIHSRTSTTQAPQTTPDNSRSPSHPTALLLDNVSPVLQNPGSLTNEAPTTSSKPFGTPTATPGRSDNRKASLVRRQDKVLQSLDPPHASDSRKRDDRAASTPTLKPTRPQLDERPWTDQRPVSTPVTPVSGARLNALLREAGTARSRNSSLTSTSSQGSNTVRTPLRFHAQSQSTSSSSGQPGSSSPALLKSITTETQPTRSQSVMAIPKDRLPSSLVTPRATSSSPQPHNTHSKRGSSHSGPTKSSSTLVPSS